MLTGVSRPFAAPSALFPPSTNRTVGVVVISIDGIAVRKASVRSGATGRRRRHNRVGEYHVVMTTVQISDELLAAARREAERRGLAVDAVVAEAVQRFVVGADLSRLLDEFGRQDAAAPDALSERDAELIAAEELAAFRSTRD